jgi:hypothetical protein
MYMREYYSRFWREVRRSVFVLWKAQIGVGLFAGVISAIVTAIRQQSPLGVALWSIAISVIGYLTFLTLALMYSMLFAPVRLDQQRESEIQGKDAQVRAKQARVIELEDALSRKHPRDEHREQLVASVLGNLEEDDRQFLTWLLHAGRSGRQAIGMAGFGNIPEQTRDRTASISLVTVEIIYSANGLVERDRYYQINPQLEAALTDLLHPPRPVAPS